MTNNAAKRRILFTVTAVILAVALILSCALAAFFYTRTGDAGTGTVAEGDGADENSLLNAQYSYGDVRPGDSGASGNVMDIASASDLTDFLNSTYYTYGRLTQDISIASASITNTSGEVKPSTNRVLAEGKTLDGNGHTITTYFYENAALDCRKVDAGLLSSWYKQWFTFQENGTNTAVDIGNGLTAYGVSNIVSVNRGTIKNLKVSVSAANGRENSAKAIVTAPEGYDGNIGMGVVAGINFGTVENCVSTINIQYGFYGSPVQAYSSSASNSNNKILCRQGLVAVGGVVGINKGNVLNTQVNQNSDIGTYKPIYTVEYDWNNKETGEISNDNIGSGIVGGVAGLNDGGVINGVDYNANSGYIYNKNNHTAASYTGVITGLSNLQNAKGGGAVSFNVGYYSNGGIQAGGSLSVAAGSVQNIKYYFGSNFLASTEAYAFTGTRGGFMTVATNSWTQKDTYVGIIGGRVSTNNSVAEKLVTGGISFDGGKYAYRAWQASEMNGNVAFADNGTPIFGYGTSTSAVNGNQYQNLYVAARLDGQNTESNVSGDFSNDSVFFNLAQVSYLWDSYVNSSGNVVSRVLYNVNFDNMPDLAGKSYSVYKQVGMVEGVSGSQNSGSDDYNASSLTNGGRIEWTAGYAPQWTLMLYSLRIDDFSDINQFNAFAATDKGTNNAYFAYAYANVVKLTATNTLSSPSLTGDKVLKNWKTLDGNGQSIILNGITSAVSGSSVQVTVGGQTVVGISDFISVNYGTIKNLNVYYGTSSRTADGAVTSLNSFAYGRVAGVNFGTLSNVGVNNGVATGDGSPTNFATTQPYAFVGLAVGANAGMIDTMHTIVWQNLSASSATLAAVGGAVGLNDGGTLKNVIVDGVASASVKATASGGESYVGGVLGAGSNYGSWTSGQVTVSAPAGASSSPFEDWTFVGKQILQTAGSNVGMLAGRISADPALTNNGNQAIREMVVMMPQSDSAVGWFTSETGKISLLGKCSGAAASSGYIATDLVVGYYAYIDDASTSYISKIYTDYNMAKGDAGITTLFTTAVYNGSSAVKSVASISAQTDHMSDAAASQISFTPDLSATTQSAFIPVQVASTDSVSVANDGNYAPAVKLYYDYDVYLSQSASDADASLNKTSLEAFITGDASSATGVGTHKILAAGANGATLTSDMSLSATIVADFAKTRGFDGGGHTLNYTPATVSGVTYVKDGASLTAVGMLASVNRTAITDVNVAINGTLSSNLGGAFAFGGIVGVNVGTISSSSATVNGSVSVSGGGVSYAGGAIGINSGVADGTTVNFAGGAITMTNSDGTLAVLGGVVGLQDYASLSGVQAAGYGATLTVEGLGAVGGVIGAANAGSNGTTVVTGMVSAEQTVLSNISNAVYGMKLNAVNGYKGLISASLGEGAVRSDALSGIAALYPDEIANYAVPWTTGAMNALSMYGFGIATGLEGLLFKVSDYSDDGGAEYLTNRTISVNGASKSFTFDISQITGLTASSLVATAKYYYYDGEGVLSTDTTYSGASSLNGNIYTTSINGTYANSASYVPALDVLIDYSVTLNNGENQQLVDFMRGDSSAGYDSYAGARKATLASGAAFSLDGNTANQRGETSAKGKELYASGNVINVSGALPTATYGGETVAGGFFAVNRVKMSGVIVATSENLRPNGYAFGLLAGANEGELTNVGVSFTQNINAGVSVVGGLAGINNGVINGATVSMNGLSASYGDKISFGALAGVNSAAISSVTATLAGTYTLTSARIYSGAAIGENSAALDSVTVTFSDAALTANPTSTAYAGGVVGKQDGGSLTNVGTAGGTLAMSVTSGNGYVGGIVGIINTGAGEQSVAEQDLAASSMNGAYAGAYTSVIYGNVYKGLIAGAVGSIADGKIQGATAHYYENGYTPGDFKIPWFATEAGVVSMYGYNAAGADTTYAAGLLFKISDYSDDGAADFVTGRTLTSTAAGAQIYFPISDFSGANSLSIAVNYVSWNAGEKTVATATTLSPTADVTYSESRVNNGGDYVPTLDFLTTYSVDIYSGTESNINNNSDGIANSMLYCFIDGVGNNQLYAGAKDGYIRESLLIYKPANGYVTMSADKTLYGGGNTLMFGYSTDAGYVLQLNDRENDKTTGGSGGYEQAEINGSLIGASGGLIAVNRGVIGDLNIEIRQTSYYLPSYKVNFTSDAAFGMLVGVNYGTVSGVYLNNNTTSLAVNVSGSSGVETVYGGIVGINAESGAVSGFTVDKKSAVNIDGMLNALYGGVVGQNYGAASAITLNNFSSNAIGQVERGVYGGAVGSNNGVLENVNVTVGTAISQNDYLARLNSTPEQRTISLVANELAIWGGVLGYNAGTVNGATLVANVNYGMSAGAGHVVAGGVVGMNDGGALSGLNATGWGGFYVMSSGIMATSTKSVFVGGLVGAMNADGASEIGFIDFASGSTKKATISDSVFALSGGMVTMNSYASGMTRYGYVTGALAAVYGDIPEGAVMNTFWFIPDKLQSVEGDDAEVLPAFHGGNAVYPTYISVFGMAPSDWLSNGYADNKAEFVTDSYGFTLVDSDDNPINYLTMDAVITSGALTLTVHKPSGVMFISTPDFSSNVTGSGGTGIGVVGSGGGQDQTLTLSNIGNKGIGYATFSFESSVYALTDSAYSEFTQYMILSFLSTKPFGTLKGSGTGDYYTYSTVDGEISRSIGDSFYRAYQVWSGATEMRIQGSNRTVTISAVPSQPLILGKGKTFNGGQNNGNKINVTSTFENNIAEYTFGEDLDGVKQTYLVVSEFIAINYGTVTNANVSITGTDGGHDIYRKASDVIMTAPDAGIEPDLATLTGFIYGMLVGVNEGEVSQLGGYSFDRTIELYSDAGSKYNSIFGGMVGAQSGADALISDIGDITFGSADRAGGITMSGAANLVAAGGVVGIAIDGRIENFTVNLTSNSFIEIGGSHSAAAVGGVVGDLRGVLSRVTFESEYQSVMKISGTNSNGTAALGNLAGVINTFEFATIPATIELVKVIGVGYLYNGIDENGTVTTSSVRLYTAGVVALGSNYGTLTADDDDAEVQAIVSSYGEIRPAKLDSVYVDFEGYVRAKANTRVGTISAWLLDGIESADGVTASVTNINYDNLKNLVWQTSCEGDSLWTTNVNYADYTAAFNTNSAVAVLGYAPVTIDSDSPDLRGVGMRLWLTNNLYTARLSTADMVTSWTAYGQMSVSVTGSLGWMEAEVYTAYYDESGADMAARIKRISSIGSLGASSGAIVSVNVETALSGIGNSAQSFPNGLYIIRVTYNEVYIYNSQQLMTFMSAGADTVKGLASTDGSYSSYANANIGIIANDLSVDYATEGSGTKAGHKYTTAVTMRADKILEGNGNNVTITTSGDIHSAVIDDKGNTPAGALLSGEYYWDYIGGLNTLSSADLNEMNTIYSIGIRAGGLFLGRNLGTIQNINFSLPNSVTIDNIDYAKWHDVITQDSWREYGTSLYVGIVTAVNAGTIDNCTLTLGENVKVNSFRKSATGPQLQKGYTNELKNKVNTMAVNGGFAGLMYGTSSAPSYISNCTVTLSDGSEIRATSQASSFSWSGRSDSVYAYAGGVVGWLTSDSTVYNVTINGTGTMTSWGDLDIGSFSSGNKVTSAGSIVGLNSDHPTYTISNNPDEFGLIDGVICNWNGAAYFLTTGNNNIFYSSSGRVNYYVGAQLAGVAEQNTLNNIYFMYGIEQYKTFHQDNWYYGDNVAARQASADFLDKYNYIVSRSLQLLESASFGYNAVYAVAQKSGASPNITEVAYKNADGEAVVNLEDKVVNGQTIPAFTFENYANYQSAIDGNMLSGATNFSLYVASGTTFYVANQYFPRITATLDSGGNKNLDFVGARAAAMMTSNGTANWDNLFKPNNVYIYEIGFGSNDGTELDMNDPDTTAYLTFQTKSITSDVAINISLASGSLGAQFVWEIRETWIYPDDPLPAISYTSYYNNVTSLEQAKANNNFTRIFDRDNDGADYTFTYVMGLAVKIAMDDSRYYYDETEGVFYDSIAKIYDGTTIDDPLLYYADEDGNPINRPDLNLGEVSASLMNPSYFKDVEKGTVSVSKANTGDAGAYRIRISFSSEGGENSKVNTSNRTIMFSDFDHIDIYTVVLPRGVTQAGVFVSKTYDGTTGYGMSTTSFSNKINKDKVALSGGRYQTANAGSGTIFSATYKEFTFLYIQDGEILQKTIEVFDGSDQTSNYAPVSSAITTASVILSESAVAAYVRPTASYAYKGEIYRKQIMTSDMTLYLYGDQFKIGNVNSKVFNALTVYDTAAFRESSRILGQGVTLRQSGGNTYLEIDGYASLEKVDFYITFDNGSAITSNAKDKDTYTVYINIAKADNFVFWTGMDETESLNIGTLIISEYEIKTADVTYVIKDGFLSKTFDDTSVIPFTFNEVNLKIVAQDGYLVQPDEYEMTTSMMFAVRKGDSSLTGISAVDVGEYDIYFRISNFTSQNYTLANMAVTFVDSSGKQISYFVLPKEIVFASVTKEFDNTTDVAGAEVEYEKGYEPVDGTNDAFDIKFGSLDAGSSLDIVFANTDKITLNGKEYTLLNVVSGSGKGKRNYFTAYESVEKGNITPVLVTVSAVSMVYNNNVIVDYRNESTSVTVKKYSDGSNVDIYPSARFTNKSAGTNKQVNFDTTSLTVAGKTYSVLENSVYVTGNLPDSGAGFAGNYYVTKNNWIVGEIIKNTLTLDDILGNITVMQTNGASVEAGTSYEFENLHGKSYTYHYGYSIGYTVNPNATVIADDPLADHLSVVITNTAGYQNGFAGTYTLELVISSNDYEWDADVSERDRKVTDFRINQQRITNGNLSVSLAGGSVYSYVNSTYKRTISPTLVVVDADGRRISSDTEDLGYSLSTFTNKNEHFSGEYNNGTTLPVGDYSAAITPVFRNYDLVNYAFYGAGYMFEFAVIPYQIASITITKEYDNSTSFANAGNAVNIEMSSTDKFVPKGSFGSAGAGVNKPLNLVTVTTSINNSSYNLLVDENDKVTNYTYVSSGAKGTIERYTISSSELNVYVMGWVKDMLSRQRMSVKSGVSVLEYRSDVDSGYKYEHFLFDTIGMRYNFSSSQAANILAIMQGSTTVATLNFTITLNNGTNTYVLRPGDTETSLILAAGVYGVSLELSNTNSNFELGPGAGSGSFTVAKQEISGGSAAGSANVFIALDGDFSYIYGESGFNLPTVDDVKFSYTMNIIDKYTGKIAATYTTADAVIGLIEFTTAADSTTFLTSLEGPLFVGGYYVWASEFADEVLANYAIPEGAKIAVYVAGTTVPEAPDPEEGEDGGDSGEGGDTGGTVVIPSLAAVQAYFILPRALNVNSVAKTYDGTDSFDGAVLTSDAIAADNITAEVLGGVYASPNANYDSTGTTYIDGNKGSDYLKINVIEITVNGNVYYTLATGGVAGNYCLTGEYSDGIMNITGAKIMRKTVDAENFTLKSDTFESVYGSDTDPDLPEVIAEFGGAYETVTYTADNVVYKQGGEIVGTPVNVGGYEMYLTGIAFDNYEVAGGVAEALVNAGRVTSESEGEESGGDPTGGESGGETGEEGDEPEPEVYTYYIVPQEIVIASVVKFYDRSAGLAYYGEEEEGVSAEVTVTDADGKEILDDEGNPLILRLQGRMIDANVGTGKEVLADFTPFGYYVNFDTAVVRMYYRLIVVGEDGAANVASNYCIDVSETVKLPVQFDEDYQPEDPENDDTPVINNDLVYNMTLDGVGTVVPAPLTIEGVTKIYDGNYAITYGNVTGMLEGDEGLKIAQWRYDDKNAGTGKTIGIETDGVAYTYGGVTYYAVYMITEGEGSEKTLSNYGVAATGTGEVEETVTDEEGNESVVNVIYAIVQNAGTINRLELTGANFSGVNVAGISGNRTEYRSDTSYGAHQINATLTALGYSSAAENVGGILTVTFPNEDILTFTATFGGQTTVQNAGTYQITLTLTGEGNYYMSAPYTVNFVIERQSITKVYVITGALEKTYDGTGDLPAYDSSGWQIYAVDKQGVVIDMSTFGDIDLANATPAFIRYNENEGRYEYFSPVNVTADPGYQIYVNGISLEGENYVFTSTEDAFGCMTFDQQSAAFETAYYKINPLVVTLEDGAFDSKKFDGSFSLRKEGVQGETVVIGDKGGVNASLAGTYGDLEITPYIGGVSVSDEALNQESVAQNYVLYYGGVPVTDATVLAVTDYTVTQADVLVAERENGSYAVGISGLQGLDFLFAKSADITDEARGRIVDRLMTGEPWAGGSFDSSSDFAKLNQAVFSVISLYVNNSVGAILPSVTESYVADNFVYTAQDDGYSLSFTFKGLGGYDEATATDRYTFVVTGLTSAVNSTNTSVTSSELESGQLTGAAQGTGVAVSTAAEFKEAIGNNQTFYLTNSIYGVDMSDAELGAFTGRLDGRGYAVSLTGGAAKSGSSAGMLVPVNGGTIENLVVKIMPSAEVDAAYVGGVAGMNNGVIGNVSVELVSPLVATGATYVGGIAGYNAAGAQMSNVSFVYSANVSASGAAYGAIAGNNAGTLTKVAVRVNESAGAGNYTVSAASAGYVAGSSSGTVNGVIVAVPSGRITGANAMFANGGTADNVYSYQAYDGASGGKLTLLEPYPDGYVGYYFATADDFTTNDMKHNELTAADEYNKSYYVDYTGGADGYIAVEAIAPYNRFIWEGYGISYRTAFGDGNVGSSLNRIVALFAAGGIAEQFDGTTAITSGVNAFTVAIGVRGGTVEVEGDVETSVKEVIYTGVAQVYKVNITVTSGGVSETKELSVGGTEAGYYSKASLEGIIGGGAEGETIGDVTYDSGSRTEYMFSGGGATVASGIALVIYPRQIDADGVSASKYYDTTSAGTLTVKYGETVAGTVSGTYFDAYGTATSQVAAAEKFGFVSFASLTRSVLAKDGVLYEIVEKVTGEGENAVVTYETQAITVGNGDSATTFSVDDTVGKYDAHDLMIAISRLADEDYATSVLTQEQLQGYEFVKVYNLTANVSEGAGNVATVSGNIVMRPVLTGENGGNYSLYSAAWAASSDMTIGADESAFALGENYMTVAGAIIPVDLGVTAYYTVGADQSYNSAMLDPAAQAERTVGVTQEEAAALGISAENYAKLVAEVAAGINVSFGQDFFEELVTQGVLEKRADGKYYTTAAYSKYCSAELPATADGGNFVVTMTDNTVTFRYFGTTVKDGAGYYTLTSADDYYKWIDNEGGTADYYAIDMLLADDIDFGGAVTDMLAWRVDGNVAGYAGTFDGNGFALTNMILDREGSAALFERIDEGAVVRNLTVADTLVISTGTGSVAGGIAVDNYGAVENCAFEGVLSATAKTGGIAATNYGTITGGVSVNRAYVDEGGVAEGIATDADDASETGTTDGVSVTESVTGSGESAVENTTIENADGTSAEWSEETLVPVITAYVFDERYVKVNGDGKFVTDNFLKLNAVDKLFGWVGAQAVTNSSVKGFYGNVTLG